MHRPKITIYCLQVLIVVFFVSCTGNTKPKEKIIVSDPASLNTVIKETIRQHLESLMELEGQPADSNSLFYTDAIAAFYDKHGYEPFWSSMGKWQPSFDHLTRYFDTAQNDGLFRDDYHYPVISALKIDFEKDSLKRLDAMAWAKADIYCTDALIHILYDLRFGRLHTDSQYLAVKEAGRDFVLAELNNFRNGLPLDSIFHKAQPVLEDYWKLKQGIVKFMDSMDTRRYTYVNYPYREDDKEDSLVFVNTLVTRLKESAIEVEGKTLDSAGLAAAVKKYQLRKKLAPDGKINASLVKTLNNTDREKYFRIAVTLDRYKEFRDSMPAKYIMVNLPGYYLKVWDADTVSFTSRIICGKPATSTPILTSKISDLVIYPTWTVPASIIKKEMLPALKKNAGYLAKKGLNLYDKDGEPVNPYEVDWTKYSKGIPYKIQQGSGDDNALGVIKFNFDNPFAVYLHDTNQRYLFSRSMRALSHGCVRVQEWEKLAFFIVRNDSVQVSKTDTLRYNTDSISNWIASKQKQRISIKYKIPLFIRYFGCEGFNGGIRFYDDIYNEDKKARDSFFAFKNIRLNKDND